MAFTWLNKQGVRSDEGFEFQSTGRFTAEYRSNGRTTKLDCESGNGVVAIREASLSTLWMGSAVALERAQLRERILGNIRAALAFQGLELELD